ncbi:AAA family ATPase [Clostridium psychrophilum]|uniref:AAA family ATPase n=1 Tax=Clostridium psychrophilum TaxID=132926 RepID=UPI001C0D97B7|nr:AAA family ATPase [Clostridium psychrophilum]MBU3181175.1 AAA family ATPase [Clostridium psychrophilum]
MSEANLLKEDKKIFIGNIKAIISLVDKNKDIFKKSIDNRQEVKDECLINFEDINVEIKKEIAEIGIRLTALSKTNTEVDALITNLTEQKTVFLRKKKINESIDLFKQWYEYKVNIDSLSKVKGKFSTSSLTTKSKDAFKEIVAGDYTTTFNKYCDYLGAPNVSIKLNPQKGQTKRSKYVVNENTKVTDIMSEGEQKAIALAEFLTDLKIRNNYCTTLFDDPVTSFDYKRAEKIADVIYKVSKERQVIIFTHNIMFYYYLYNSCSKKNKDDKFFDVGEYDRDNKGMITENFSAKLDNLKSIVGKIKNEQTKIDSKKCLGSELESNLQFAYSIMRTWCELIVEEGFFNNIIRRFAPNILFGSISKINGEFVTYIPAVTGLFNKCCRYVESHSQPYETQNIKPSREEFDKDVIFILELSEKYRG